MKKGGVTVEEWKKIEDFENYSVSENGEIRNDKTGRVLKPRYYNGYQLVSLSKNGKVKKFKVHRLVAEEFIPNPDNKPCVDHINTVRDDNRVENLRWCTCKENCNNPLTKNKRKGKHHSEETKQKISEAHKGENNYWYGKHHSEEHKQKMSKRMSGENNPNYGKQLSEEHKQKISEANCGENHPQARKIICITTGEIFDYIKQASKKYGVNHQNISKCCRGKRKSCGKHPETGEPLVWMYYFDNHEGAIKNE